MSSNFVERFCHKHFQKNPKKSKDEVIKKLTHLFLNGQKLEEIGEVDCKQLKVLYLHNNSIKQITNLNHLTQLTHLYLQWNRIKTIENLTQLTNLRKLYLSYNEIECLTGLENQQQLEELHLEYQNLLPQQEFSFDLNSLIGISTSLRVLNVSGLNLTDLNFIRTLPNLNELNAADNSFDNSDCITSSIEHMRFLTKANFSGCPAHKNDIYYRNKIILVSKSLTMLDNKMINEITRSFLKSFDRVKSEQKQKTSNDINNENNNIEINLRDDIQSMRSEGTVFDVSNIITQAIVENVENKPWILCHEIENFAQK